MSEELGYTVTLEDYEGKNVYPTAFIENILSKDGTLDTVPTGIVWNSKFIVNMVNKTCFIAVNYVNPKIILVTPTIDYDPEYKYYVNGNMVNIKTSSTSEDEGIGWKAGIPIQCIYIDNNLYIGSSKNDNGDYLNNIPVYINNISNGELLQYYDGKIIPYNPPVKFLYQAGQNRHWHFEQYGSDIAVSPSGCENENLRVCIYGNGDELVKGTAICESDMFNFSGYSEIIIKYSHGYMELRPEFQIIDEDDNSYILDIPYIEGINTISFSLEDMNLKNAKILISASATGNEISEITIYEIKIV